MMTTGTIILLNGTGSAGKTSIARELQAECLEPVLHIGMDLYYIEVCPPQFLFREVEPGDSISEPDAAPESVLFFPASESDLADGTAIVVPRFGRRLMSSMHHAVAAAARLGNHVVVDHVLWVPAWLEECVSLWHDFSVYFVGVRCPLAILEAREGVRADRSAKGVVRWQYPRVHRFAGYDLPYDLEVDTSTSTVAECAAAVLQRWQSGSPTAFVDLRRCIEERGTA